MFLTNIKRYIPIIFLVLFILSSVVALSADQGDIPRRVSAISFNGLKVTKEKAVTPQLYSNTQKRTKLEIGSGWTKEVKSHVKQSLLDMGLFDSIEILDEVQVDGSVHVIIKVNEKLPLLILPFGDFTTTRGFRLKALFRYYNVGGYRKQFWIEAEFSQLSTLNLILRYVDPAIGYNDRWSSILNVNIFTSAINFNIVNDPNLQTLYNRLDEQVRWNEDFSAGSAFTCSVSYRIPKIEATITPQFDINYTDIIYNDVRDVKDASGDLVASGAELPDDYDNIHSLSLAVGATFGKSWVKEGELTPTGNKFDASVMFYLPTTLGENNDRFRFNFTFTDTYYKTFKHKHHFKFRARFFANYNMSKDYSSELRGTASHEFEGWIGALINFDYFLPLFSVDFSKLMNFDISRELLFQVYWSFFIDVGATLVEKNNPDVEDKYLLYNNNVLRVLPGLTAGTGIRIYPKFINLIIRVDVGINGWKFIRQDFSGLGQCFEFFMTFSKFF